jgi:sulfatase modifying factor 1
MIWVEGGTFLMGSNRHYREERPAHPVALDGFWIDQFLVTNADFARFVEETGHVTQAERPLDPAMHPDARPELLSPGSMVFVQPEERLTRKANANWWRFEPGAMWRRPQGAGSSLAGKHDHPVVHVAFDDALAYAIWAGKTLPTEAEWEFASRGGLDGAPYAWGEERQPGGAEMANTWQGEFPWENQATDGFVGTSPVGRFPANGYGLYDMIGNVWEWTTDWYVDRHAPHLRKACCAPHNPTGPAPDESYDPQVATGRIPRKVIKGGSHLCAPNYCRRYRPAARYPQPVGTSTCHVGFRCVARRPER